MTREELEARKQDLQRGLAGVRAKINEAEAELQTLRASLSATDGALQECNFWLTKAVMDKPAPELPEGYPTLKAVP